MSERPPPPTDPDRGITRRGLELVIRRAAEMAALEADADERLSEAEVLRIAEQLGLPDRHVRQALYELPRDAEEAALLDRWYGTEAVVSTRVVPGDSDDVLARLEDYLVTREFLQVLRKQGGRASFQPADDAISSVARAVRRPQRSWQIARARRVLVEAREMPGRESHVRVELDLGDQRRRAVVGGGVGGLFGGLFAGAPLAAGTFLALAPAAPGVGDALALGAAALAGTVGLGSGVAVGIAVSRATFKARVDAARLELAGMLDRLESGGRLDPPAAPWLRSLRSRIAGSLRPTDRSGADPG
ncbi:MAG TPA: hypothetical protein VMM83_01015 [Longimicrobiales bacterium]|nr:hypothetical protein [Longimicrobiales bacterium]